MPRYTAKHEVKIPCFNISDGPVGLWSGKCWPLQPSKTSVLKWNTASCTYHAEETIRGFILHGTLKMWKLMNGHKMANWFVIIIVYNRFPLPPLFFRIVQHSALCSLRIHASNAQTCAVIGLLLSPMQSTKWKRERTIHFFKKS